MDHSKLFNQISQTNASNRGTFTGYQENISDDDDAGSNIRETVVSSASTIGSLHDTRTCKKGSLINKSYNNQVLQSAQKDMYPSHMRQMSRQMALLTSQSKNLPQNSFTGSPTKFSNESQSKSASYVSNTDSKVVVAAKNNKLKPSKQPSSRQNNPQDSHYKKPGFDQKSRSSTPDHQELIENERVRFSVKAEVADENFDYADFDDCEERQTISDINLLHKELYVGDKSKVKNHQNNFSEFSKEFFAKNDKDALAKQKYDMQYQANAQKFREQTQMAKLAQTLGRKTDHNYDQVAVENYHDEGFMNKIQEKIRKREAVKRDTAFFESPNKENNETPSGSANKGSSFKPAQRVCVDYRYLNDKIGLEATEDIKVAKNQASKDNRYSTIVSAQEMRSIAHKKLGMSQEKQKPQVESQDAPMIGHSNESTPSPMKPKAIKKILQSIDTKQKEHDEMRNRFLKLITVEQETAQDPATKFLNDLLKFDEEQNAKYQAQQPLRGRKDVNILSVNEWNTLVNIYRDGIDHSDTSFDPLQIVSRERVRKSIINGIPENLRGEIWCMICRCSREKNTHAQGMYQKLVDPSIANPADEHRIRKDIGRTFTNYPADLKHLQCEDKGFNWKSEEGQKMLYNVLLAYSNYDSQIGYVQGMNYIAGMLLMHIQDEEQVFWCLLYIMNRKNWRCIYKHELSKLLELLDTVEEKIKKDFKAVYEHLQDHDFTVGAAFSPLFITLYIYQIDHDYAMRIFESFMLDGEEALLRILYKMIEKRAHKILEKEDMELITYLRTDIINECIREEGIEALLENDTDLEENITPGATPGK